jgi:lysophospholipase L1-like esterase
MKGMKPLLKTIVLCCLVAFFLFGCDLPTTQLPLSLVVVGDSISAFPPVNCEGCVGFADRYAASLTAATDRTMNVNNLSQRMLQIDGLITKVGYDDVMRDALTNADIIIVSIAFNDVPWLRNDDPCDGITSKDPDWSKFDATCAAAAAEVFRPKFEDLFARIIALRNGKPTIFLTINRYNDWIGWEEGNVTPEAINATRIVLDAWNAMVCKAAQDTGFLCADVYHAFNGSDGLTPALDLLATDYTHPSDKGHEIIAGLLSDFGYSPLVP